MGNITNNFLSSIGLNSVGERGLTDGSWILESIRSASRNRRDCLDTEGAALIQKGLH